MKHVTNDELNTRLWLRPKEVQQLLGIGSSKFWNWVDQKHFSVSRPDPNPKSRVVLVNREEVERFVNTGIVR